MSWTSPRGSFRALLLIVGIFIATVASAIPPDLNPPSKVTLTGKVRELSEVVKVLPGRFDVEPIAGQVVLVGPDGSVTPLLSDDASRALFKDARLRNRPTEVVGLRHPGLPYLQVILFKIEEDGRLRTPEYYCEICSISVRYPQSCPCCQDGMVLQMQPDR